MKTSRTLTNSSSLGRLRWERTVPGVPTGSSKPRGGARLNHLHRRKASQLCLHRPRSMKCCEIPLARVTDSASSRHLCVEILSPGFPHADLSQWENERLLQPSGGDCGLMPPTQSAVNTDA